MVVDYQIRDGSTNSRVYSIANLTYDFLNGTSVNVSNVNTRFEPSSLGAELGFGGAY